MERNLIANPERNNRLSLPQFPELKLEKGQKMPFYSPLLQTVLEDTRFLEAASKYGGYYLASLEEESAVVAVKSKIGRDTHPLISFYQEALWYPLEQNGGSPLGCWVLGVDKKQNCYFSILP